MIVNTSLVKCITCKEEKQQSEYYKSKYNKSGFTGACKECTRKRVISYNKDNHEKHLERAFKHQTNKRYGITPEQYAEAMSTSSKCQICESEYDLCYDHDHITGKFRGVLCRACNRSIGQLGDTKERLKKAYEYLM